MRKHFRDYWQLYLFLLPALFYMLLFQYIPMFGITIAFENYKPFKGILGSDWVGLKHFIRFFTMRKFGNVVGNTLRLSIYSLLAGFPLPILLALLLNACRRSKFKKVVQTVTYAPHFISVVVVVAMINVFFSPSYGFVRMFVGSENVPMLLTDPNAFPHLYVWSEVWQSIGWNSIIYLGTLTGVDPQLHESALIDGANRLQRIVHIDLPAIMPTVVLLLILNCGRIMNVGFEKVFLMQNSMNITSSEILSTYIYKMGINDGQYSFSTVVGLFNSVVNFAMLLIINGIARLLGDNSLM